MPDIPTGTSTMPPAQLARIGEALYHRQWQTALSEEIGVSDRTVRRWAAGTHEVPQGAQDDIWHLVEARGKALATLLRERRRR